MRADYGLWPLVVINSLVLVVFAASFFHPRSTRDWRVMGGYSAFIVALFTEMYGAPLTVYLLSGWLGSRIPALKTTHSGGHLWNDLIGWKGDPHLSPFHLPATRRSSAGSGSSARPGTSCTRPPRLTGSRSPARMRGCATLNTWGS